MTSFLFLVSGQNGHECFITHLLVTPASNVVEAREMAMEALECNETIHFVKHIKIAQTTVNGVHQIDLNY